MALDLCAFATAILLIALLRANKAGAKKVVHGDDVEKVLEIARGYGSAEIRVQDDGITCVFGQMQGLDYRILFLACDSPPGSGTIQFWTNIPAPTDPHVAVNDWNTNYRFGKAYIRDDGDIAIEMDVNLVGGLRAENLDSTFVWWRGVMVHAFDHFGRILH